MSIRTSNVCLLAALLSASALAFVPAAAAAEGPVAAPSTDCYDIYWYREVGPVVAEARSSCDVRVYLKDNPTSDLVTADTAAGIPTTVEKCVSVLEGGDMGYGVCVDPAGPCYVSYYEVRFTGTYERCLVGQGSCGNACEATAVGLAECVSVLEGGDMGYAVCVYRTGPCAVSYRETTFLGTEEHCLVYRP